MRPHRPALLVRIGAAVVAPRTALARVERDGGGVSDSLWLVVLGTLAFRLEELARAVISLSHVSVRAAVMTLLRAFALEMNLAAIIVLPAAVLVTLLAGRGRRDPGRDLELGAVCYAPFFVVRAAYGAVDAVARSALPAVLDRAWIAGASVWALATVVVAIRVARLRIRPSTAPAEQSAEPARDPVVSRAARAAAGALAAALVLGFSVNLRWVARHADAVSPLARGAAAPDFTLRRIDGQPGSVTLSSLRGRVVLLDFWATWCPPCVQMIPTLHHLHEEWHPRGIEIVGVDADGAETSPAEVAEFLRKRPAPYPIVVDDGTTSAAYKVTALPHLVIVGRNGEVASVFWGYTTKGELEGALAEAIAH